MACSNKLTTVILFILLHISIANAKNSSIYPKGCEERGFGYSGEFLVLNETGEQTFYLIQNKSNHQIELENHEVEQDVFMSPKLETKIFANRWAAFASDVKTMHFACFAYDKKQKIPVQCEEVLNVCQYPRVKFASSNMGNYWVSTNKAQSLVVRESIRKGIFLRW